MKEVTQQLTAPQRKGLIDSLGEYGEIFSRARRKFEDARNAAKDGLVQAIAKEEGADKLFGDYKKLKAELDGVERRLDEIGFDADGNGHFTFNYNTPRSWHQRVEDALEDAFGTRQQVLDPIFETARVKLWLAATAEEAENIVEPLLNFEVKKRK